MSPQKRKFSGSGYNRTTDDDEADNAKRRYDEGVLRIQAHEADTVRGPMARIAAETLEVQHIRNVENRTALMNWNRRLNSAVGPSTTRIIDLVEHDDSLDVGFRQTDREEIWVDRYDVFHSVLFCKEICYGKCYDMLF
jgi:hypothetical protein